MRHRQPGMGPTERLLLTIPEAADLAGIGKSTLWELVARGQVPSIKIGKLRRINRRTFETLLESGEIGQQ